ncbi:MULTISPECIES: VOC family protein [unclassified Beijerinckia]|uniref:VOC family protein n=1 Tax=unclassified Beijerinckia TaxID=2638183 RepID=UPI000899F5C7|nr:MULTISPECIES: VOC family protein [unclassified Beijerinckia]MDH7798924.1 catechol 2,3-dioxygenase-like lactoylglutathione lyase family enzyme [Beijerinckia sp. GAS462]SED86854.1 Predicted lactoylglutathione lyase [Beijerinckia sp. 28-YEA-48]
MSLIREKIFEPFVDTTPKKDAILQTYMLSHGTLMCRDMANSRKFYEEFLGFECAQHAQRAMCIRHGLKLHIVVVQVGDQVKPNSILHHWGLEAPTQEYVDDAYKMCLEYKDKYGILEIKPPQMSHGSYGFYFEDLDHNWWEILHHAEFFHDDAFDFGDRFPQLRTPAS